MSPDQRFDLEIVAQFDDGQSVGGAVPVTCDSNLSLPARRVVSLSVPRASADAEAFGVLVTLMTNHIDELLGSVVPLNRLDEAIEVAAQAMLGLSPIDPTPVQIKKFNKFMAHPRRDDAIQALHVYIGAVRGVLHESTLGKRWGVTASPSSKTLLRVNVWYVETFVFRPDGTVALYQQGDRPVSSPAFVHSTAVEMKTEKPNFAFELDAADLPTLLSDPAICAAAVARVERYPHDLIQPNFHNPLTTPLLFPTI